MPPGRYKKLPQQIKADGNKGNIAHLRLREAALPEPPPGDIVKPSWLTAPYAVEAWEEYVPLLQEMRVLTVVDVPCLANLCTHLGNMREFQEERLKATKTFGTSVHKNASGGYSPNPYVKMVQNESALADKYMTMFGMSPAARTRIDVTGKKAKAKSKKPVPSRGETA